MVLFDGAAMAMSAPGTPVITVIMPVYNAAGYIAEAARSILAERVEGLELLAIDDGSTDSGIAELTALDDARIRVVRQENAGLVAALNRGLDEATGEFIARMDADDISVPGRLEAQLRWLRAHPDAVVCGTDYELFGSMHGRVRMPRSDRACRQRMLIGSSHCGASILVRRRVIERSGLRFDPSFAHAEDYEFLTRLAAWGQMGNLPIVGYRYRMHGGQVSSVHASAQRQAHLRVAAAAARRAGVPPLRDEVVVDLLWPPQAGRLRAIATTTYAAAQTLRRSPSLETARFAGRKIVERTIAAIAR